MEMKTLLKVLIIALMTSFAMSSCRTGDDGTKNHGQATEGMFKKKELQDTMNDRNSDREMIDDEPAI